MSLSLNNKSFFRGGKEGIGIVGDERFMYTQEGGGREEVEKIFTD